ncbi:hypothetical protein Fot_14569 [Forsythia ovata]|uniref:Uncharacterized protein n=1 Tax=Forsythia ovata TaxID=205694 RepID=A0ABD1W6Q5_9LAMI
MEPPLKVFTVALGEATFMEEVKRVLDEITFQEQRLQLERFGSGHGLKPERPEQEESETLNGELKNDIDMLRVEIVCEEEQLWWWGGGADGGVPFEEEIVGWGHSFPNTLADSCKSSFFVVAHDQREA